MKKLLLIGIIICLTSCARIKGMGFDYSRLGDQNIEGFEYTQTLPDGTVNQVKFSKQQGGDALLEALKLTKEAVERIPKIP